MSLLLPFLFATGCHLFEKGYIQQTCTELGSCEEEQDDSVSLAGLGWITFSNESGMARAIVIDESGLTLADRELEVESSLGLDLAWIPGAENLAISTESSLVQYSAELGLLGAIDLATPAVDLRVHDNAFFIARADSLDLLEVTKLSPIAAAELLEDEVIGLLPRDDHQIEVVTFANTGSPADAGSLWGVNFEDPSQIDVEKHLVDYDSQRARSKSAVLGPGAKAHVCSGEGHLYDVLELAMGINLPVFAPEEFFEDVVGCAYDGDADQLVLFSAAGGVVWVGSNGVVVDSWPVDEGSVLVGAYSW